MSGKVRTLDYPARTSLLRYPAMSTEALKDDNYLRRSVIGHVGVTHRTYDPLSYVLLFLDKDVDDVRICALPLLSPKL